MSQEWLLLKLPTSARVVSADARLSLPLHTSCTRTIVALTLGAPRGQPCSCIAASCKALVLAHLLLSTARACSHHTAELKGLIEGLINQHIQRFAQSYP